MIVPRFIVPIIYCRFGISLKCVIQLPVPFFVKNFPVENCRNTGDRTFLITFYAKDRRQVKLNAVLTFRFI